MHRFKKSYLAVAAVFSSAAIVSQAAVPTYVSDALTAAGTTFTEYLGAAAPVWLTAVAAFSALVLIASLIRRAMRGR